MRITNATDSLIQLGKQGEHLANQVRFPYAKEWRELYGEGTFQLAYQRAGDTLPYAVLLGIDDDAVTWDVANTDVAVVGRGKCELTYIVDSVIAKSMTFMTNVNASMSDAGDEPPEPWESWVDEVMEAGAAAVSAAASAAESKTAASASATSAAGFATIASEKASLATGAASVASLAESHATAAKEVAVSAKEAAVAAKNIAVDCAESAETDAENARVFKDEAEGFSDSASGSAASAGNAASTATSAAVSAENSKIIASAAAATATEYGTKAVQAEEHITGMSVEAHLLDEGSEPEIIKTGGGDSPINLDFGIPKGDTGRCDYVFLAVDITTGMLQVNYETDSSLLNYSVKDDGHLEVSVNVV